jgi:hypothetical protein
MIFEVPVKLREMEIAFRRTYPFSPASSPVRYGGRAKRDFCGD